MKRRATFLLCGATLLLGIVIGAASDSWPLTTTVEAKSLDPGEAERLYRELGANEGSLIEGSRQLSKIARLTTPSVVHIQSEHKTAHRGLVEETGSGVLMSNPNVSGVFVATNRHVVNGAELRKISIHLSDGRVIHPTHIWDDKATDIAVMKVYAKNLHPARWGDSDKVDIGHMVLALGSPFGLSRSVTYGIISAKGRRSLKLGPHSEVLNQDFLQTDAAINPGNSGGPLIDLRGRVIGINTAIASNSGGNDGIGFSIPSNLVRRVIGQLLVHGKVQRAYLGVKLDPAFSTGTAARLKLDRVRGARIVEVYPNTPAARANLKYDDVILSFRNVDVQDENHLINLVSLMPVDHKPVKLVVFRSGRAATLRVVLSDRAELDQRSEAPSRPDMGTPVVPMGLTLHKMNRDIAAQLGFDERAGGLLVLKVDAASPLFGELRLYDLIEEVARTPVRSVADLDRALRRNASSETILLKVRRRVNDNVERHLIAWQR